MQIHCPRCGVAVPGADINLASNLAVCRPCGEVIPLGSAPAALGMAGAPLVVPLSAPSTQLY